MHRASVRVGQQVLSPRFLCRVAPVPILFANGVRPEGERGG